MKYLMKMPNSSCEGVLVNRVLFSDVFVDQLNPSGWILIPAAPHPTHLTVSHMAARCLQNRWGENCKLNTGRVREKSTDITGADFRPVCRSQNVASLQWSSSRGIFSYSGAIWPFVLCCSPSGLRVYLFTCNIILPSNKQSEAFHFLFWFESLDCVVNQKHT